MPRRPIIPWRGLGHLLLASPDCTIGALNLPLQAQQVLICFQPAPDAALSDCQSGIGRRARRDKPGAEHIIGPPVYLIRPPHKSLVLSTQQCSSQLHPALLWYLGTVEPRDLTASSRYSPGKHWSLPHRLATVVSFCLSLDPSTPCRWAIVLWPESKFCLPMSQNVSATCTADVTAPLANSSPKSRLALAVEPPDQPPRYPPPDRIHSQDPRANCREPPLRFRLHIRP